MTLFIDTTEFNKVTFAIVGGKTFRQSFKIDPHQSHETLKKLDEFFHKSKILNLKSKISLIVINKGPGSFTGVRVGLVHALALGLAWNIPVKALAKEKFLIK